MERQKFLVEIFEKYIPKEATILEIGCGDGRNIEALKAAGYTNVSGIDKKTGSSIEKMIPFLFDTIFTMSTLFLLPVESEWVFKKIARMAQKFIITIEGETTKDNGVIGRDYSKIFGHYGFEEVEHRDNVFNMYGHLRVLKNGRTH